MSLTRAETLKIRNLRLRRERERSGLFVVEGLKSVMELRMSPLQIQNIWATAKGIESMPLNSREDITIISSEMMTRISSLKTPPGILATAELPRWNWSDWMDAAQKHPIPLVLVADGLNDPGNLGTLIRTAHWLGCSGVAIIRGSADPFNAKSVQASMGSVFHMPIVEIELAEWLNSWQGDCAVLEANGQSLDRYFPDPRKALALVVGSESHGPQPEWVQKFPERVGIPMGPTGGQRKAPESLNAAMAAGIAAAEIIRKWRMTSSSAAH